jgi:thymidylate synthase
MHPNPELYIRPGLIGYHATPFINIFDNLLKHGSEVAPRNQLVRECQNFSYVLPPYVRFCNFKHRKLSLKYIKAELLWYLRGDKFDLSILDHASLWSELVNKDNSINSNYGQYIFGDMNQFDRVVDILKEDKDSRRASILILSEHHTRMETKDVPCTYSLNFRIRKERLEMSVHMRSQDGIFGMGNDAPAFSVVHEMLYNVLLDKYPDLKYGEYFHIADSFHVYEKHFSMIDRFTANEYELVHCPKINGSAEVAFLRKGDFKEIPPEFKFSVWLQPSAVDDPKQKLCAF